MTHPPTAAALPSDPVPRRVPEGPGHSGAARACAAGRAADDGLAVLDDPVEQRRFTRYLAAADGQAQAESALRITGMHCAACAALIEQALAGVDGVLEASVSAAGERARVRWVPGRTSVAAIVRAIRAAGYDAAPDAALAAREQRTQEHRQAIWRLFVAAFCAMQVMMMATPSYVAQGDDLAPDLRQLLNWGSWLLSLPVLVFAAGPFFQGAWRSLRARRIGMDVPVSLGLAVTFVASTGATFDPQGIFGHEVYFDSLTMFVSFLLGGRLLETRARHRVAQVLEAALQGMPETAERLRADGQSETVSVQRLAVGDEVRVPVGQAFPGDGLVLEGDTRADESLLTGESVPVPKPCGAAVVAGSLNLGAPVRVRLLGVGEDTRLAGIVALMRDAMSQRPALARAADRWAGPFLWLVLVLAAGAAAVWSVIDPSRAVWVAVSVLIVTCPCALSLAAPAAMLSAASALARRGLLLQRLDALEALTRVSRLYMDKTGTVTEAELQLQSVHLEAVPQQPGVARAADAADAANAANAADNADAASLQARAAALAGWSAHPLSRALVAATAAAPAAPVATAWQAVQELPGQGLQALDAQGRCWRLGSRQFVAADAAAVRAAPAGHAIEAAQAAAQTDAVQGAEVCFGHGGHVLAVFGFDEALRADAVQAVAALRADGVAVVLLSGDQPARARRMAERLAVDAVIGGATPEAKLAEVARAQAQGLTVAMIGDGINDAPVLARADVSFAMGQGALVARAQADAVVASGRLADVALARRLARRTLAVVRQNILWAVAYNLTCIPLALAGWLPPWAAGLGMALSSLLVIANALRLAR
ncbi:heavy metal translocating P-type ATPase [Aquabacterium sp. OR-4]|uniref:heavy metal translocating P-type ATPase n=1 Tax=Aquabacterium sp. OR-4 TaxID=2978127 RepID=UPI0021B379A0|nr:cation-translocating P-type ATPase [Aquabacterium sp. OR-4]MDT7835314.1 cation-translocating P-type ATPase [Aquabacterium sp. OR-4]